MGLSKGSMWLRCGDTEKCQKSKTRDRSKRRERSLPFPKQAPTAAPPWRGCALIIPHHAVNPPLLIVYPTSTPYYHLPFLFHPLSETGYLVNAPACENKLKRWRFHLLFVFFSAFFRESEEHVPRWNQNPPRTCRTLLESSTGTLPPEHQTRHKKHQILLLQCGGGV